MKTKVFLLIVGVIAVALGFFVIFSSDLMSKITREYQQTFIFTVAFLLFGGIATGIGFTFLFPFLKEEDFEITLKDLKEGETIMIFGFSYAWDPATGGKVFAKRRKTDQTISLSLRAVDFEECKGPSNTYRYEYLVHNGKLRVLEV